MVRGKRVKVRSISIGFQIGELRVSKECMDTESGRREREGGASFFLELIHHPITATLNDTAGLCIIYTSSVL